MRSGAAPRRSGGASGQGRAATTGRTDSRSARRAKGWFDRTVNAPVGNPSLYAEVEDGSPSVKRVFDRAGLGAGDEGARTGSGAGGGAGTDAFVVRPGSPAFAGRRLRADTGRPAGDAPISPDPVPRAGACPRESGGGRLVRATRTGASCPCTKARCGVFGSSSGAIPPRRTPSCARPDRPVSTGQPRKPHRARASRRGVAAALVAYVLGSAVTSESGGSQQ